MISIATAQDCGQEEMLQCQRSLSELNQFSDLLFLSRKGNLQKQCPDLLNGLECVQSYTRRCMNIDHRAHFNKLYAGTAEMVHQLCEDTQYQEGKYVINLLTRNKSAKQKKPPMELFFMPIKFAIRFRLCERLNHKWGKNVADSIPLFGIFCLWINIDQSGEICNKC